MCPNKKRVSWFLLFTIIVNSDYFLTEQDPQYCSCEALLTIPIDWSWLPPAMPRAITVSNLVTPYTHKFHMAAPSTTDQLEVFYRCLLSVSHLGSKKYMQELKLVLGTGRSILRRMPSRILHLFYKEQPISLRKTMRRYQMKKREGVRTLCDPITPQLATHTRNATMVLIYNRNHAGEWQYYY